MPLVGLEKRSDEEFVPYLKYNAKAGRWYNKIDGGGEVEVHNLTAIFDLAGIKTGWILYADGMAPDRVWHNGSMVPRPSPKHKSGFSLMVYSQQQLEGVREFGSTSAMVIEVIRDLYDNQFENAPEARQGMVPVIKCESVVPVKGAKDTNYQPVLRIVKWVPRPEALKTKAPSPPARSAEVPPPVTAAQAATSDGDSEEF